MIKTNARTAESRLLKKLDKVEDLSANSSLNNFSSMVQKGAKRRVRVKTGELRDSIIVRKKGNQQRVVATAPHASIIEFGNKVGTQAATAYPFFYQDVEKARDTLVDEISKEIGDILK